MQPISLGSPDVLASSLELQVLSELVLGRARPGQHKALDHVPVHVPHNRCKGLVVERSDCLHDAQRSVQSDALQFIAVDAQTATQLAVICSAC